MENNKVHLEEVELEGMEDFSGSGNGQMAGTYETGNETFGSIKFWYFLTS